jgi:DNA-binding SARP family transcriptional activator/tetratricopeptide (TPR) repeat protein
MEFRILGSFDVVGPTGPIDVRGAKRRGLLACLLVNAGRPMSRDRLVEELWGNARSVGAARTVQTYVSQLRKLLRREAVNLVTSPGGYVLEVDPAAVDAFRFEQGLTAARAETDPSRRLTMLESALALWRGPPLDEFAGAGWADREATRLVARHLQALRRRCETLLDLGRAREAAAELETLVGVHSLDEGLWAHLMLALYRSGRQADALAVYQQARRHLVGELGIEPGPELIDLEHRILAQDPTLLGQADSPVDVMSGTVTATFLFCDLVDSTALLTRLGDDAGDEVRRDCYAVFRDALATHGGREVKSTGDGVFGVFPTSVEQAVACAIAMQQGMARLDAAHPLLKLGLRVGIAMGEAKAEDGDWYGTPVVEAERLCAAAHRGQILVADVVCTLAGTRGGHPFRSVGALKLKGLGRPLPASEVEWPPDEVAAPATHAQTVTPQLAPRPAAIEVPLPAVVRATRQGEFVDREVEQQCLAGVWAEAKAGRRQMVLMAGEPGIGKSRLAAELAAMAHGEGAVVLWGRCDEGMGVAYQPVAEALRHYVRHCGDETLDEQLGGARGQLAHVVPELAEGRSDHAVPSAEPEAERLRMFDAVSVLLGSVARSRPLLLVQDDLHWAATPTLLLLRQLARPADDRVLIVGTYRDTELDPGHPLQGILADLRREPTVVRLAIDGLDEKAVVALVEAEAGHARADAALDLAPALHAETDGNPFFIGQVLGHLIESGALDQHDRGRAGAFPIDRAGVPEGLREVIERRVARQPKAVRRILTVAAVIGRDFTLSVLERIPEAGATGNALLRGLERAARARLVQEVPGKVGRFAFVHDVVRQTLYEGLSGPRRARLHRRVGEALTGISGVEALAKLSGAQTQPAVADDLEAVSGAFVVASGSVGRGFESLLGRRWARVQRQVGEALVGLSGAETQPAVLAHHFVAGATAGCRSEAIVWSERAGAWALEQFAYEDAVAHFQHAIGLLEWDDPPDRAKRARLLVAEHKARGALGDVSGAKEAASRAVEDARSVGSAELLAEATIARAWWIGTGVPDPETAQLLQDALAAIDEHDLSRRAALLGVLACYRAISEGDGVAADPLVREAISVARSCGNHEVLADVLAWRAQILVLQGSPDIAELESLLAELATLPRGAWHLRYGRQGKLDRIAAIIRLQGGDLAGFDAALERVARLGEESQDRFLLAHSATWNGLRALLDGRFNEVEDYAAEMLRWAGDDPNVVLSYGELLFYLRWAQGRLDEIKPALLATSEQTPNLDVLRVALAIVHIELNEPSEARAILQDIAAAGVTGGPRGLGWSATLASLAEVSARLGDTRYTQDLRTALAPYTGQLIIAGWGTVCLGAADRYLGMLAATGGRPAEGEALFNAALALEESVGSAPLASRTRVAHARALVRSGDANEVRRATQLLETAAHMAARLGMAGLMHEIDFLRRERPRRN